MKKELEELRKKLSSMKDSPMKKPAKVEEPEEEDEEEDEDEEDDEEEEVVVKKVPKKKKKVRKVVYEEEEDEEEDEKTPTLSAEEEQKVRELQIEQERLQNDGAFRMEMIYQLHLLNESVAKLTKLLGGEKDE